MLYSKMGMQIKYLESLLRDMDQTFLRAQKTHARTHTHSVCVCTRMCFFKLLLTNAVTSCEVKLLMHLFLHTHT